MRARFETYEREPHWEPDGKPMRALWEPDGSPTRALGETAESHR